MCANGLLIISCHFGEDKTKCILFSKEKNLYDSHKVKQFHVVEYLQWQ